MKMMKRVLSFLLAAVIVLGLVPVAVFAAQETVTGEFVDAAIFASDVHGSSTAVPSVFAQIQAAGINPSVAGFVGDTNDDKVSSSQGADDVTEQAQTIFSGITCLYNFGSHDDEGGGGVDDVTGLLYGNSETSFYVYSISQNSMSSSNPNTSDFTSLIETLDQTKPLFIMSHMPLHARRNDNHGAAAWYTAISAAADKMDIVFFWGHNHTSESGVDTAAYYVAKDGNETMSIQGGSTVTPNFTYMNAGYIGNSAGRGGVATTVQIYAGSLVFQDYNSSGAYTGSYAHNVTVEREFAKAAAIPKTLSVTGETLYQVGDTPEISEVKITYMNETEKVITEGYDLSKVTKDGVETAVTDGTYTFDAVGTYTLTYTCTVSGYQAQANLTVTVEEAEVTTGYAECWDSSNQIFVKVTSDGITEVTATNVTGENKNCDELFTSGGYVSLDIEMENYTAGNQVEYSISVIANMDTTNLELYYQDESGNLIPVEFTMSSDSLNNVYLNFTTTYQGTFVYGSAAVPEGYTASKLTLENIPKDVFQDTSVDLTNAVITVTYTKEGEEDFVRKLTIYDYTEENWYYVDEAGAQTFTFTFDGVTATQPIYVWGKTFALNDVTVTVGDEEFGVGSITVDVLDNSTVADAIDFVIEGDNFVAYDISLNFAEGYATKQATKTVTLPIPAGVTNPVVYYVPEDGSAVVWMSNTTIDTENNTITFTTTHFSTYVVGENQEITVPDNETASGSQTTSDKKYVYVLTSTITEGNSYLIVNSNVAGSYYALANNSGSVAATGVTVKTDSTIGTYIELVDATDELWTVEITEEEDWWSTTTYYNFLNGDEYLYYTSSGSGNNQTYSPALSSTKGNWTWASSNNRLSIYAGNRTRYLRYSNGWGLSTNNNSVYFYILTEIDTSITYSGTYTIEGTDETVAAVQNATVDLSSLLKFTPESGDATTEDVSTTATYEIYDADTTDSGYTGDPLGVIQSISGNVVTLSGTAGKALVKVSYTTDFGTVTDYITITAVQPVGYSIELHKAVLTQVASDAEFDASKTYYIYNTKTGFYEPVENLTAFEDGVTYYVTPVIQGEVINDVVVLKGIEGGEVYAVWAVVKAYASEDDTEGIDLGALGDSLTWTVSDIGIASINTETGAITFTGEKYGDFTVSVRYTGADGKIVEDEIKISATESLYTVPEDGTNDFPEYPNEGAVRFDKTASAVGAFSQTGIAKVEISMTGVPYSTGNELDVVLMLDMTGSMSDDGMEAAELATIAFVEKIVKNEDGTYNDNRVAVYAFNSGSSSPYELVALTTIDSDDELATATAAIKTASDKQASGGTPFDEAAKKCQEVLTAAKTTNLPGGVASADDYNRKQFCVFMSDGGPTSYEGSDGYTYYGGNNGSGDRAITSYIGGYTSSTSSSWTYNLPTEYYTDQMKADDVTVYTVGLLLQNAPSNPAPYSNMTDSTYDSDTDSLTTIGSHYYFTSTILKNMASDESKYIDIFDVDNADKATAAFEAIAMSILEAATNVVVEDKIGAGYTVNFSMPSHLNANATAGLEEFYIQLVDYVLDPTTHERTDDYTVLENFTFNANGTLKSHTINGIACGTSCAHVTTTDGKITKIEGTYFQFEENEEGQFMHCQVDKLSSTELALQYFVYLLGSEGTEIPAGTYYTNEYATITYTNYRGVEVQNEFPVPQMTWNGAQVRYVFYLVNEKGQPVNRQGRVVPFSEAVYVTDVFVDSMVWNKLDQNESFDAALKAAGLLPDVYELYDKGARYDVHVFENEYGSNLNNHFLISSAFTQTQVTAGEKAWTTYVFNNKSDTSKYNVPGYYALGETFWCIGLGTVNLGADGNPSSYNKEADEVQILISYDGKLTGFTQNQWQELGKNEQYAVILINDADYKVGVDKDSDGNVDGYYLYYKNEDGSWYTIVNKESDARVEEGFDFANTAVAFAVVWTPGLKEDTVVVDFGLDVVVDVITNDVMIPGVVGLGNTAPTGKTQNTEPYDAQQLKAKEVELMIGDLVVGKATITDGDNAHVRITFDKANGMQLSQPVSFFYEAEVEYYAVGNGVEQLVTRYMYSKVTIIPATTVYYEDEYVTLTTETKVDNEWTENEESGWVPVGNASSKDQAVDRPGADKIGAAYDADNNYGYDAAYDTMSEYSMGSAAMVQVYNNYRAKATFEFYGTGFDVISLTSNTTGTITVSVYPWDKTAGKYSDAATTNYVVDTYYGYTKDANGEWVVSENTPNALYQVPVMKVSGLSYGKYKVVIVAAYGSFFDHGQNGGGKYDFYLDAIRIYDPCGTDVKVDDNTTVGDIYEEDGEGWPTYQELRNMIITADTFNSLGDSTVEGVVFIDSADETNSVADYTNYGPNNELYLAPGQAIAFELNAPTIDGKEIASIQLGIKTVGKSGSVKVYSTDNVVALNQKIATATDMYYDIQSMNTKTVVIENTGAESDAIISLTNIKVTYKTAPSEANEASVEQNVETIGYSTLSLRSRTAAATTTMATATTMATSDGTEETTTVEEVTYMLSVNADTVARALEAMAVEEQVESEEPGAPVEPEVPEEPETPEEPEVPEEPETPEEPEIPEEPETPEKPEKPEKPDHGNDKPGHDHDKPGHSDDRGNGRGHGHRGRDDMHTIDDRDKDHNGKGRNGRGGR